MMDVRKCEQLAELISAYSDGEVTAEERVLVESHLRDCPDCAQRLAYYQGLGGALRDYLAAAPAPSSSAVIGATQKGGRKTEMTTRSNTVERARFRPLGAWAALAAVVVLALGIGVFFASRPAPVQAHEVLDKAARVAADPLAGGINSIELERTGWAKVVDGRFGVVGSEVHNQQRIVWQAPNLWRIESEGAFADVRLEVSDGQNVWQVADGQPTTVQKWEPQLDARKRLMAFTGENLTELLANAEACYSPRLTGEEQVAGRTAYVIDLGATKCPAASGGGVMNGRRVIWVDKETFFVVKSEHYAVDENQGLIAKEEATRIVYNGDIDPDLFSYDVPAGVAIEDLRPGPAPTGEQYREQLTSLAAKVEYQLFVPSEVPAGLEPRQPRLSPSAGVELAYVPPAEVEQDSAAQEHGIWISQQHATEDLVAGWTAGMEAVTVGGDEGWLRRGERNPDGTATDSGVTVVREGTMVSLASFAFSAEELLDVAESLVPVAEP